MQPKSFGDCELPGDGLNVPVNISMEQMDETETEELMEIEGKEYWRLTADNYMPRRSRIATGQYMYVAETEEELLKLVRDLIVPQYEIALNKLRVTGNLYHWDRD